MSATAEIRSKLPLCGRCKNCKVIVWGKEAKNSELKTSATIIKNSDVRQLLYDPMQLAKNSSYRAILS